MDATLQRIEATSVVGGGAGAGSVARNIGVDHLASILQDARQEKERLAKAREEQLRDGEFLCPQDMGRLKRVVNAFAQEDGRRVSGGQQQQSQPQDMEHLEPGLLSVEQWVQMLNELQLVDADPLEEDLLEATLTGLLGVSRSSNGTLTVSDAVAIFDLTVSSRSAASASAEAQKNQQQMEPSTEEAVPATEVEDQRGPRLTFDEVVTALRMVAKRTRQEFKELIAHVSFSHLAPAYRPAWVDLSQRGVSRRLRGIFSSFTGGAKHMSRYQWRKVCTDCYLVEASASLLTDGKKRGDLDALDRLYTGVASRLERKGRVGHTGLQEGRRGRIGFDAFLELLREMAALRGLEVDDIVGQVAWSFGPMLEEEAEEKNPTSKMP